MIFRNLSELTESENCISVPMNVNRNMCTESYNLIQSNKSKYILFILPTWSEQFSLKVNINPEYSSIWFLWKSWLEMRLIDVIEAIEFTYSIWMTKNVPKTWKTGCVAMRGARWLLPIEWTSSLAQIMWVLFIALSKASASIYWNNKLQSSRDNIYLFTLH